MCPYSDAEAARQAEAASAKIETVKVKKVYIHMREAVATWRRLRSAPGGGIKVSVLGAKNKCRRAAFELEKGSSRELTPNFQIENGQKRRDSQFAPF